MLGHALLGRPTILLESWDAALAARLVDRFKVAQMSGTPFHLSGLMEAAEKGGYDLGSFEQFLIGATTVPPALVAACEAAGIRCCRCYGSTELPTATQCVPADPLDKRLGTDGRPKPGVEVRIVGDGGEDLPVGTEGEVAVRGAERFLGYTDPELNAASFLPGGWFLTGDIGRLDPEGYLAITDRKKDIIIRGGENISSREVEELLLQVPGVREAAAIGALGAVLGTAVLRTDLRCRHPGRRRAGDGRGHRRGLPPHRCCAAEDARTADRGRGVPAHPQRQDPEGGIAPGTGGERAPGAALSAVFCQPFARSIAPCRSHGLPRSGQPFNQALNRGLICIT